MLEYFSSILLAAVLLLPSLAVAQAPGPIIAKARNMEFRPSDLSDEGRLLYENQSQIIAQSRTRLLSTYLAEQLLEAESKAQGLSIDALVNAQLAKVSDPTDAEIRSVYDANRDAIGDRTLAAVRDEIVAFLREEPEQKVLQAFVESLEKKYELKIGKDINAPDLKPADVVAELGTRKITANEFEEENRVDLHEQRSHIYEELLNDLEEAIIEALILAEAKERNTDPGSVIAAEISNKMRDFSNEERDDLQYALRTKLFTKYAVRIELKRPEPLVHKIDIAGNPILGSDTAPVTLIMFTDLQCPACAATHPVLKRLVAMYSGKVRLAVRDFPLTGHEFAFPAALAANAAHRQGKYFEFIDILYSRQRELATGAPRKFAAAAGLDLAKFDADAVDPKLTEKVRKDLADGERFGVQGTPTIFINGEKIHGISYYAIRSAIDRVLAK
jgi:protein-disulfide isomerase